MISLSLGGLDGNQQLICLPVSVCVCLSVRWSVCAGLDSLAIGTANGMLEVFDLNTMQVAY